MKLAKRLVKFLLFILLIILLMNTKKIVKIFYPLSYQNQIVEFSKEYTVDPYLICAIIKAESNFKENAISPKDAKGLMQVTTPTAKWIAEKLNKPHLLDDPNSPDANIEMGTFYIGYLLHMYDGNEKCALSAYNAGFNIVDNWLEDDSLSADGVNLDKIPYRETELYVTRVEKNKQIYKILYDLE